MNQRGRRRRLRRTLEELDDLELHDEIDIIMIESGENKTFCYYLFESFLRFLGLVFYVFDYLCKHPQKFIFVSIGVLSFITLYLNLHNYQDNLEYIRQIQFMMYF